MRQKNSWIEKYTWIINALLLGNNPSTETYIVAPEWIHYFLRLPFGGSLSSNTFGFHSGSATRGLSSRRGFVSSLSSRSWGSSRSIFESRCLSSWSGFASSRGLISNRGFVSNRGLIPKRGFGAILVIFAFEGIIWWFAVFGIVGIFFFFGMCTIFGLCAIFALCVVGVVDVNDEPKVGADVVEDESDDGNKDKEAVGDCVGDCASKSSLSSCCLGADVDVAEGTVVDIEEIVDEPGSDPEADVRKILKY